MTVGGPSPFLAIFGDKSLSTEIFRRLLRDLLREASYLPDPWVRKYHKQHILDRYRSYLKKNWTEAAGVDWKYKDRPRWRPVLTVRDSTSSPTRLLGLFKEARIHLNRLAKANLGHTPQLIQLIMRAYGRSGKRRHDLLESWMKRDNPKDTEQLKAVLQADRGERIIHWSEEGTQQNLPQSTALERLNKRLRPGESPRPVPFIPKWPEPVRLLIASQRMQQDLPKNLRAVTVRPIIPEKNEWMQPFPMRRARRLIMRWRQGLEERLLPPLPNHEFARLKGMVLGHPEVMSRFSEAEFPKLWKRFREEGGQEARAHWVVYEQPQRRTPGTKSSDTSQEGSASFMDFKYAQGFGLAPSGLGGSTESESEGGLGETQALDLHANDSPWWKALQDTTLSRNLVGTAGSQHLTKRHLRRLYKQVYSMTCKMEQVDGEWTVFWGSNGPSWRDDLARMKREKQQRWQEAAKATEAERLARKAERRKAWEAFKAGTGPEPEPSASPSVVASPSKQRRTIDSWMFVEGAVD